MKTRDNKFKTRALRRYKRRVIIFSSFIIIIILTFLIISISKFSSAIKTIKKFQSLIQSNFKNVEEVLDFNEGEFNLTIPKPPFFYKIQANIATNITHKIPLKEELYKMKDFKANIIKIKAPENKDWLEKLDISSNFIAINKNEIELTENIKGLINSHENKKLQNATFFLNVLNFYINSHFIKGEGLFAKSGLEVFKASSFKFFLDLHLFFFEKNVMIETPEYKIFSDYLDVVANNKNEVQEMKFRKNVRFFQKGATPTFVKGENAVYNKKLNTIKIYDNVFIKSANNNTEVQAEYFEYNEITKKGSFKANNTNHLEKVKISLDI